MSGLPFVVAFGGASFGNSEKFSKPEDIKPIFDGLDKYGVDRIDTAQLYGKSEEYLGQAKAGEKFVIDTKWFGGFKSGSATKDNIISSAKESIQKLGVDKVDIFYIHAPDTSIPFSETLEGVNEVYKLGLFKRFGLSNFTPSQVEEVVDISKKNGYPAPDVYQGNYSAVARIPEADLFPVLRKHNISFYAYSPLAGGLLTKSAKEVEDGAGRFGSQGFDLYRRLYFKPAYMEALGKWEQTAKEEGIDRAELGFRWTAYNSQIDGKKGDGLVIGASRPEQLHQTMEYLKKGPLSDKAAKAIDEIWELIKHEAPIDNFNHSTRLLEAGVLTTKNIELSDPRQWIPPTGQKWTSLGREQRLEGSSAHRNHIERLTTNVNSNSTLAAPPIPTPEDTGGSSSSAWSSPINLATTAQVPDVYTMYTLPKFGIGERVILIPTPDGTIMWDLLAYMDDETIEALKAPPFNGIKAIVISHPHYYTNHLDWAEEFNCPVYISEEDENWVSRKDVKGRRKLISSPTEEIVPGMTAIKVGGHFPGSLVLHWKKMLFLADSVVTQPSALYHINRPPGTISYTFMWSIPNMIPLAPSDLINMWRAIRPFEFEQTHGAFMGQDVFDPDVKQRMLSSMQIQVRGATGHEDHEIFAEKLP